MKTIDRKRDLFIGGIGLGASLMYALDPRLGRRRRAIVRDKFVRISRKARQNIDTGLRDLRNRAFGLAAATRGLVYKTDGSDQVIADRVRSELGFWVSHPSSIEVSVTEGRLTLTGRILEDEVDRLLREISSLRGVKSVENRLEAHKEANSIPDLQGQPSEPMGRKLDIMQSSWSPATRLLVGTATAGSLLYGVTRRGPVGAVVALLSGATLSRALTNLEFKRLIGIGAGHRAIDIQKIINVSAPVEEVFAFWANYENFPCFMRNVREVKPTGKDRSRWVVAGPADVPVEWGAITSEYVPNKSLAWKTVPGSPIQHTGIIRFQPNPDGTTRLDVRMSYNPVAGGLGHLLASLFGADPKSEMDADLVRMKTMIETGVQPHDAARRDETCA